MSLSADLIASIKKGFYVNASGVSITYKDMLIELVTMAKTEGYSYAVNMINTKLIYINRRQKELSHQIDAIVSEMSDLDFDTKYEVMLNFLQENSNSDSINIPILESVNSILSLKFSDLKNTYHELSVVTYKQTLFETLLLNLTQNKNNVDTILGEIKNIT